MIRATKTLLSRFMLRADPTLFNFSFGFMPNTVSELAAAIRMDNSHKTTPAICQFIHSSFSASKPPGEVDDQ